MKIPKSARQFARKLYRASFTDGLLDHGKVGSLVQSVVKNTPRDCVAMLEAYRRYLRLELERRRAVVEIAVPTGDEIQGGIRSQLEARFGSDIAVNFIYNPDLIGGIRIRLGSDVWDGSVKGRLQRLERELAAG